MCLKPGQKKSALAHRVLHPFMPFPHPAGYLKRKQLCIRGQVMGLGSSGTGKDDLTSVDRLCMQGKSFSNHFS